MTNVTQQSVTRTAADLQKLDLFSSLWGIFLHKQTNPHEFMVTAIEQLLSIFKPGKLSIFLFDTRYQQRMEQRSKEARIPESFVLRKMNLSQSQTFLTLAKNESLEAGPYLFKHADDL